MCVCVCICVCGSVGGWVHLCVLCGWVGVRACVPLCLWASVYVCVLVYACVCIALLCRSVAPALSIEESRPQLVRFGLANNGDALRECVGVCVCECVGVGGCMWVGGRLRGCVPVCVCAGVYVCVLVCACVCIVLLCRSVAPALSIEESRAQLVRFRFAHSGDALRE